MAARASGSRSTSVGKGRPDRLISPPGGSERSERGGMFHQSGRAAPTDWISPPEGSERSERGGMFHLVGERLPHLLVARRGPDARIGVRGRFVVRARHVEGEAVIEDYPVAVFRPQRGMRIAVDRAKILAFARAARDSGVELADEGARTREALGNLSA